jgi:hypothetical protein
MAITALFAEVVSDVVIVVVDVVVLSVTPTPLLPVATNVQNVVRRVVGVTLNVAVSVSVPPAVTVNVNSPLAQKVAVPASCCLVTVPIVAVPADFASDDTLNAVKSSVCPTTATTSPVATVICVRTLVAAEPTVKAFL